MQKVDLHIHTIASDGLLSPEEVVRWASIKRLKAIGITDHDTINGISEAMEAAPKYDIEIVPGIELSTQFGEDEVHMLGYYIDYSSEWLKDKLEEIRDSRYSRAVKMISKLNTIGVNITLKQVEDIAEKGNIGRPHIARAMVEKGYINNMKTAFQSYINKDGPAYVERYKLSCKEAIDMIISLGGVPVLAHPGLLKNRQSLGKLLDMGVMGMEVYHSKHDSETIRDLMIIANSRKLIITGGSDCHGVFVNNEPILGSVSVDYKCIEQLKAASTNI